MLSRLWLRAWSPGWRLLSVTVALLLLHSLWAYVEARRLENAARGIAPTTAPRRYHRPRQNRADDAARFYEAAWALDPGVENRRAGESNDTQRQRDAEWLRIMEPSLAMLDGGAGLVSCRFLWTEELPNLRAMRELATAGSLRTRQRLQAGDRAGALASTISSLRHLRVFMPEAPVIAHMVRSTVLDIALGDIQHFLEHTPPGSERARLRELVDSQIMPNAIEGLLIAERAWLVRKVDEGEHWIVRPAARHFAVGMLDYLSRAIEIARSPWPERLRRLQEMPEPRLMAGMKRPIRTTARATALAQAMSACLQIEQHRHTHGTLPEALNDSTFDPFSGQPLKYRREEGGYVVYSVGDNGTDDGGLIEGAAYAGLTKDYGYRIRTQPLTSPR